MIDGHQNDVSFVSIDSEFNNITGIQNILFRAMSSKEALVQMLPNLEKFF